MKNIISHIKSFIKQTDNFLLLICIALSTVGILSVQSATLVNSGSSVPKGLTRDATVMLLAVVIGIVLAILISCVNYDFMIRLWPLIGLICMGLVALTLIIGVGPSARSDARTWIRLGGSGLYFQPSELWKVGFIITFASHLDNVKDRLNKFSTFIVLCIHGAIPVALVTISGDMGSALIFFMMFVIMMFASGVHLRYFALGAAVGIASIFPLWNFVFSDIQKDRILALINPESYPDIIYQQEQGLKAIKSGGFFGAGLFKGYYTQNGLIPEGENDMILATVGEELGLVGCIVVFALFFILVFRIASVGRKSKDSVVNIIAAGAAAMIASQVIINVGMVLEIFPVIGITLPFLSAGGSSNLCIYLAIGIVMSLRRHTMAKDITGIRLQRGSFSNR